MWRFAKYTLAVLVIAGCTVGQEEEADDSDAERACGTHDPSVQEREYHLNRLQEFRKIDLAQQRQMSLTFKVVWHVIHNGNEGRCVQIHFQHIGPPSPPPNAW
jgi:hypothetical protein